jgi:hypothetical protein
MTRIDGGWLEAFDEAMLGFFAIDHADAGMDQCLLECYSDLPAREAALAFGENYELCRVDRFLAAAKTNAEQLIGSQPRWVAGICSVIRATGANGAPITKP